MNEATRNVLLAARPAIYWPGAIDIHAGVSWVTFAIGDRRQRLLDLGELRRELGQLLADKNYAYMCTEMRIAPFDTLFHINIGDKSAVFTRDQLAALHEWLCLVEGVEGPPPRGYDDILRIEQQGRAIRLATNGFFATLSPLLASSLANNIFIRAAGGTTVSVLTDGYDLHYRSESADGVDTFELYHENRRVTSTVCRMRIDMLAIAAQLKHAAAMATMSDY